MVRVRVKVIRLGIFMYTSAYSSVYTSNLGCCRAMTHMHVYMEKTDLVLCISYEDETSADGEQHQVYKTYPS